jgi:serine/threonine protein kinase
MLRSLLSSVVAVSLPRWPGAGRSRDERGHQRTEPEDQPRSDRPQSPSPRPAEGRETGEVRESLTRPTVVPKSRYRIVGDLGAGAFGNVSRAEDETTGQDVAIRFLPRGVARASHAAPTRQPTGGSIVVASAAHPALVRVLEFSEPENGHAFVAMELAQGRRLSEVLSEGPLEADAARRMALDLGGAVATLHKLGLVHGALRPHNVMVREDGGVKLMDVELIGLRDAWAMKEIIAEESPAEYFSPEQIRGVPATEATDVYAFAVILYEMLCGRPPFQAQTRETLLAKHLTETAPPMRRQRRTVPVSVDSVVALALSKAPPLRPSLQSILNSLREGASAPAIRWKRKAAIVGGGALAASIATVVGWALLASGPSAPRPLASPAPPPAAAANMPTAPHPASSAFTTEVRTASPLEATTPAVAPPAVARPTPPSPLSPVAPPRRVDRRVQTATPQTPPGPTRDRTAAVHDPENPDFSAVIDWLQKGSTGSGR